MRARAIGGCREVQKMKNLSLVNLVTSRDLARSQRVPGVFRQAPAWGNRALAEACIMQGCSGKIAQVRHRLPQQRNGGTAVDLPMAGEQECKMGYGQEIILGPAFHARSEKCLLYQIRSIGFAFR